FIATSDGGIDWLDAIPNTEQSDYGYAEFMSGIDAIVMGRNTFEQVLTFGDWPYPKPVFVLSRNLNEIPEHITDEVKLVQEIALKHLIRELHQQGHHNLYIDGGRTIQSFLEEDLIDEMIITRVPILLGNGFPLFGRLEQSLRFKHKKTDIYNNGLIKSHYIRER
ncbi:MAG: dihydrofolate reductase family protein, partial [Cyanobacteria bacterium J06626_18]